MNEILRQIAEVAWSRILIAGVIALVAFYFVGFNDGDDTQKLLSRTQKELSEAQTSLKATKEAMANAEAFEREVKETVDQFNRVVPEIMPVRMSTADLTTIASEMSNKSGAKLTKTEPKPGTEKGDFYDTTRISLSVEGTFSQIAMFLSDLSRVPKLMTFDHVEITALESAGNPEVPRLVLDGILKGYRYVKPSEQKPGEKAAEAAVIPGKAPNAQK